MLDLISSLDSKNVDTIAPSDLIKIRKLTQISSFKFENKELTQVPSLNVENWILQFYTHPALIISSKTALVDFFKNMEDLEKNTYIKFNPNNKKFTIIIPNIKNFLLNLENKS